jgi:hypothetical protein
MGSSWRKLAGEAMGERDEMPRPLIHRYRSVATEEAINILLERMSHTERCELNARLMADHSTIQEYVGALLTAHERWDLVEWDEVTEEQPSDEETTRVVPSPSFRQGAHGGAHPR